MNIIFAYSNIFFTRRIDSFRSNLSLIRKKCSYSFGKVIITDSRLIAKGLIFKSIDTPLTEEYSSNYNYSDNDSEITLFGNFGGNSFSLTFKPSNKSALINYLTSIGIHEHKTV